MILKDEFEDRRKMWSQMSTDFMRKCNFFSIPNQVKDDGNHIHPQSAKEKDKPVPSPDWSQPEMVDLNILMREVNDCSREWVDKQINKLRRQNNTRTYEKMKSELSYINDDERTISDVRVNNDEERQAPKRIKGMSGGTQAKDKEIVSQESKHKKHKSSTP